MVRNRLNFIYHGIYLLQSLDDPVVKYVDFWQQEIKIQQQPITLYSYFAFKLFFFPMFWLWWRLFKKRAVPYLFFKSCKTDFLLDIDECNENGKLCINGQCENTIGSYRCICRQGFQLSPDGAYCLGLYHCTFYVQMNLFI